MSARGRIAGFIPSMLTEGGLPRLHSDINCDEISFDRYRVRPGARQLFRDGRPIALNGKAFDLLIVFLASGGRVLRREDLYERLWGERIVEEANLSQTVYLLRRSLDPDGDGRAFVETIPRVGYRFVKHSHETRRPQPPQLLGVLPAAAVLCALMLGATSLWSIAQRHPAISGAARVADQLGEYHLALRTPDHLSYALAYFREAERAAPGDAFAYAGAASAYALLAEFEPDGSYRQRAFVSFASASSDAALRRARNFSPALAVRGFIAYRFQGNRALALRDLERAIAVDSGDAQAHHWYGVLLMMDGNLAAATGEFETAHRLAPTSEVYSRWLARAYAFERKPYRAIAAAQEALRIEPDDAPAMLTVAGAQEQCGNLKGALSTLQALIREDPYERPFVVPDAARLEVRLARGEPSLITRRVAMLADSGSADPFETALLYLTSGRKAAGLQMLRRASGLSLAIQRYDPRLRALL